MIFSLNLACWHMVSRPGLGTNTSHQDKRENWMVLGQAGGPEWELLSSCPWASSFSTYTSRWPIALHQCNVDQEQVPSLFHCQPRSVTVLRMPREQTGGHTSALAPNQSSPSLPVTWAPYNMTCALQGDQKQILHFCIPFTYWYNWHQMIKLMLLYFGHIMRREE